MTSEQPAVDSYTYDANGNMTCRIENGVVYTHTYNAENRASSIAKRNTNCTGTIIESWSFAYDGDGTRVSTAHFTGASGTPDSTTSYYMGGQFEIKDGAVKKYYSIAGMMVAMNDGTGLQYLLTDHLGSTVAVTNQSGTLTSQQRYLPFGAPRAIPNSPILGTDFTYTGQRMLDSGMGGIMDYKARFYSPYINRFLQPDSIIPDQTNPQSWNRFSYVTNNPIGFSDPTGHEVCWETSTPGNCLDGLSAIKKEIKDAYGVTLSDDGATYPQLKGSRKRAWDLKNAALVWYGLAKQDSALGGHLKTIIGSAVFTLNSHPDAGHYFGYTTYLNNSNVVDFYNNSSIPLQNLYHEFGHVLDNSTGDAFTTPLGANAHYQSGNVYLFGGNGAGFLDPNLLYKNSNVDDPYYGTLSVDANQHNNGTANEQWADMWANYVSGNIDQSISGGAKMYSWITRQINSYLYIP